MKRPRTSSSSEVASRDLPVLLREVLIATTENGKPSTLRLITNLTDVSATTIGLLYRQRRQVELFFRWLKSIANFRHPVSHSREGMLTQLYVTLIAMLLMYLHTG
jgi:IS4 transposase